MGLSPYGNMDKNTNPYYKKLKQVIDIKEDGSFRFDMRYFIYHYADRMPSKRLCKLLDGPIRKQESELTQRHKDIAAALQLITEEILTKILNHIHKEIKCDNVVLAGGVAYAPFSHLGLQLSQVVLFRPGIWPQRHPL